MLHKVTHKIHTENVLSALVHWEATQGGGKRCQFTLGEEARDKAKELLLLRSAGTAPGAEKSFPFGIWGGCAMGRALHQPCSVDIHRSESAVQQLNCSSSWNVAQGSSPLNLPVLLSCKYLLQFQAWPLSPQDKKYSVKSSVWGCKTLPVSASLD